MFKCEIKGFEEVESLLKGMKGEQLEAVEKNALKNASPIIKDAIKANLETFKDKGYTVEELTLGNPVKTDEGYKVRIGWKGKHNRYAIVHLNEFGYSKNGKTYHPRGLGKIELAYNNSKNKYMVELKNEIKKGILK